MRRYFFGFVFSVFALTVVVALPPVSSVAVSVTLALALLLRPSSVAGAMIRPGLLAASLVVVAAAAPPVFTVQLASQVALIANLLLHLEPGVGTRDGRICVVDLERPTVPACR